MSNHKNHPEPIAPDSVHLWRGYNIPGKTYADFSNFLGSIFVPACALMQPNIGLHAYIPSMPSQEGKPSTVPDQTALMFWKTPEAYTAGFNTLAVRAYTNLHTLVYDTTRSKAGFPIAFQGTVVAAQPYYLINQKSDWMLGGIRHLVGARKADQSVDDFISAAGKWAQSYAANSPAGADGALLCVENDYLVFWEHFTDAESIGGSAFDDLGNMVQPFLKEDATRTVIKEDLWSQWKGLDLGAHACLNIQLHRP